MLSIVKPEHTRYVTQDNIYAGVDAKDVAEVAEQFGVTQKIISDLLGVSLRAIQNRRRGKNSDKLDKNASERILRMRELMSVGIGYFGNEDNTRHWFNQANTGLGDVTPISLCDTFLGMERVENSIQKLMHGMTA